jgi:hypothetical protein
MMPYLICNLNIACICSINFSLMKHRKLNYDHYVQGKRERERIQGNARSIYIYIYMIVFIVYTYIYMITFKTNATNEQKRIKKKVFFAPFFSTLSFGHTPHSIICIVYM